MNTPESSNNFETINNPNAYNPLRSINFVKAFGQESELNEELYGAIRFSFFEFGNENKVSTKIIDPPQIPSAVLAQKMVQNFGTFGRIYSNGLLEAFAKPEYHMNDGVSPTVIVTDQPILSKTKQNLVPLAINRTPGNALAVFSSFELERTDSGVGQTVLTLLSRRAIAGFVGMNTDNFEKRRSPICWFEKSCGKNYFRGEACAMMQFSSMDQIKNLASKALKRNLGYCENCYPLLKEAVKKYT